MSAIAGESPTPRLFTQSFIQAQIKENMKSPRHPHLWGELTGDRFVVLCMITYRTYCHLVTNDLHTGVYIPYKCRIMKALRV